MIKKGTKSYSVIKGKCPRCNEGDFFKYGITYNPKKVIELHNCCSSCKQKYMIEPSFYFGAMYVNYAIAVALVIIIFVIAKLIINLTFLQTAITIVVVSLLLSPLSLRFSRIIWINFFVYYDPKLAKEAEKKEK
ncbi:DUF983 domain-containing protein [Tenacibaculum sp. UWU-22]|uniref:DUF983 domain-containing protein n=1 Tax=Tenacibaculum sp. UWU-22 TaxID=3234187 RepID=UPI0034DAC056